MLTVEGTRAIAEEALRARQRPEEVVLTDREPTVRDWCVVWTYNSRRYLEEGVLEAALAGNVPMVVDRRDGTVRFLLSYAGVETTLPALEHELGIGADASE